MMQCLLRAKLFGNISARFVKKTLFPFPPWLYSIHFFMQQYALSADDILDATLVTGDLIKVKQTVSLNSFKYKSNIHEYI